MSAYEHAERGSVGLGRAMLALLVSSMIMFAIRVGVIAVHAVPHSLGGELLYFVALVVGEALMLRWCLTWFGWTISVKAAIVARLLAGVAGVIGVLAVVAAPPLRNVAVVFLVMFVVQYVVAGWVVVLAADPVDGGSRDRPPMPARPSAPVWQDDSKLYTAEDFLADSRRAGVGRHSGS